jgi:hypothetical protein
MTTRSPGATKFATSASMPPLPVPDSGSATRFSVRKVERSSAAVSSISSTKAGSR